MSNLKKWAHVNKTYSKTSRAKIVHRMYSLNRWRVNWYYWLLLLIYVVISSLALAFSVSHFYISFFAVLVTALALFPLLERQLAKDLKHIYEPYCLNDYPLFSRPRYLHFVTFKQCLDEAGIVKPEDVPVLLQWDDIKNEKVSLTAFFESKLFLIVFTAVVTLGVKSLGSANLEGQEWMIVFYLILVSAWLFWLIFDLSQLPHRQRVDLNRFLKWYAMERQSTNQDKEKSLVS